MKSPRWHRDEILLALDLYRTLRLEEMNKKNLKVIELSKLLNEMPIHDNKSEHEKFRNPTGVELKLANFKAIDPDFEGKGLSSYSKRDEEIFLEFKDNDEKLSLIVSKIKNAVSDQSLSKELERIQDDVGDDDFSVKEGKIIYKIHKLRERDSKINSKKKAQYLKKYGKLDCEVCSFDFQKVYGDLGKEFIEAHHRTPLSEIDGEKITTLDDLALVCSNCHRMLHRAISTLSIAELRNKMNSK